MTPDPDRSPIDSASGPLRRQLDGVRRLFTEPDSSLPARDSSRARLLSYLLLLQILILILAVPISFSMPAFRTSDERLVYLAVTTLLAAAYALSRTRHYNAAAWLNVAITAAGAWGFALIGHLFPDDTTVNMMYVIVSVVLCSVLLSPRATAILSGLHLAGIIVLPIFLPDRVGGPAWVTLEIFIGLTAALTFAGAALRRHDQDEIQRQSAALVESGAQVQSILDNSTAIIYLKDVHGRYLLVNQRFENIFHIDRGRVIGRTAADIFPPEQAAAYWATEQLVLQSGESLKVEDTVTDAGGVHTFLSVKFALRDPSGKPYAVGNLSAEITEGKQIEEALRQSDERFRLISYATSDAVWDRDFTTGKMWWNQTIRQLFGYDPDHGGLDADWWEEHIHPDDREAVLAGIRTAIEGGEEFWSKEYRFRRADDTYAFVFDRGYVLRDARQNPARMLGAMMDITERKRTEDALIEERYLLHTLMDNVPDVIYFKDTESRFISVNNAFAARFGFESPQHLLGKTDFDIFGSHASSAFADEQNIISTGHPILYKEEKEDLHDGTFHWVLSTKLPMRDARGKIVGTFGISSDITGRKKVEEELHVANHKLINWVDELERRTRETSLLNEMSDLLQACSGVDEAYKVIAEQTRQLFPREAGGLYILNASRNVLEKVASWGPELTDAAVFKPDECWALRRGRLHVIERSLAGVSDPQDVPALLCRHIAPPGPEAYLCLPLAAQGEALGVLHMRLLSSAAKGPLSEPSGEWYTPARQQLANAVADSLSLALANLKLRDTLRQQSIRDPLTGLFNRRYLEESLDRELRRAARAKHSLGVIMLDLDHFKDYNDRYGHEGGDALLRELGVFLSAQIRGEDIPCRYGGEEFALIMPEAPLEITRQRAERIREGVRNLRVQHHARAIGTVTVSLGVACFPEQGPTGEDVMRAADEALYRAKKAGRDRVIVAGAPKRSRKASPK